MTTATDTRRINMQAGCDHATCAEFAFPLFKQLRKGYEECSVLRLPVTLEDWRAEHRTARKRADRSYRLGYEFRKIQRSDWTDDIYSINTSLPERQGRPMSRAYFDEVRFGSDRWDCPMHAIHAYGVTFDWHGDDPYVVESTLVAYLWVYRSGELALVSSILGHGDHLRNDIMYLLVQGVIDAEAERGGYLVYNRHDSGTDGLRYFKERLGFTATEVAWAA